MRCDNHRIPFSLGIGIDDIFIISQCLSNVNADDANDGLDDAERIALALKQAGVSITITSLTDIVGFSIATITVRDN